MSHARMIPSKGMSWVLSVLRRGGITFAAFLPANRRWTTDRGSAEEAKSGTSSLLAKVPRCQGAKMAVQGEELLHASHISLPRSGGTYESMADFDRHTAGMYAGPVRRPRSADDQFFDDGNVQRALLSKMSVYCVEDDTPGGSGWCAGEDMQGRSTLGDTAPRYECVFRDCTATFSSLQRHETHYETCHRNCCSTCGRSFPNHRLLDLHLSEAHDSFFKAMAERRAMYVCLVEGCPGVFHSTGKRHAHLVQAHRYPENFDFSRSSYSRHPRKRGGKSNGEGSADVANAETIVSNIVTEGSEKIRHGSPKNVFSELDPREKSPETGFRETMESDGRGLQGVQFFSSIVNSTKTSATSSEHVEHLPANGAVNAEVKVETTPKGVAVVGASESGVPGVTARDTPGPPPSVIAAPRVPHHPRGCKFWRTTEECRAGIGCAFQHGTDDYRLNTHSSDTRLSDPMSVASGGRMVGECVSRGGEGGNDAGSRDSGLCNGKASSTSVSGNGMEIVSGVDEIVNGMQKLLIPKHLSFGRSARRGTPIGSVRR